MANSVDPEQTVPSTDDRLNDWNIVSWLTIMILNMSHVMRKPIYAIYVNNKGADQPAHSRSLIGAFVVHCLDSMNTSNFYIRNFKPPPSFFSWAGWFESYLVLNPEDRFSLNEAHMWVDRSKEQFDQGLHCFPSLLHLFDTLLYDKTRLQILG